MEEDRLFDVDGRWKGIYGKVGAVLKSGYLSPYNMFLTMAVVSMVLTPLISSQTSRLYGLKKRVFKHEPLESLDFPEDELCNHVVIAGCGRIGS